MPDSRIAVLLVHGAGAGGWEWSVWRAVFEAVGLDVHAPDLRPSMAGLAATVFADYRDQVGNALGALPRPRVAVGASLGGLLVACQAARVDALVLVDPVPPAPFHERLPRRTWPDVVPWRREARLAGTRGALPGADAAAVLHAFRHWRDESGPVLREAQAGIAVAAPACPVLCLASTHDRDVPFDTTRTLADAWGAELMPCEGKAHAGALFDRDAAAIAARVADWIRVHVVA